MDGTDRAVRIGSVDRADDAAEAAEAIAAREACSARSASVGESLIATAPIAACWIIIEQPGPWGRQALLDSRLGDGPGPLIAERSRGTGTTVVLARHPSRTERSFDPATRRAWIAHVAPGSAIVRTGILADPGELLGWDLAAMARGHLPPFGERSRDAAVFLCTHSGRDACCAVHGRALIDAAHEHGLDAWECSHLGGHRFAPTALTLPDGCVHGRLDIASLKLVHDSIACGRIHLPTCRGRTALAPPLQCADLAVRDLVGIDEAAALDALPVSHDRAVPLPPAEALAFDPGPQLDVEVRHADGRAWRVMVHRADGHSLRPESCGGEPVPCSGWAASGITETRRWTAS